jgi:uncharacterized tellurite resistance protein B-like protein
MIGALRRLFHEKVAPDLASGRPEAREHGLRLAAAALLFEVVRSDADVKPDELSVMRAAVQSAFGLSAEETDQLVSLAGEASRQAASVYEFTEVVDRELDAERKKRLVELLWLVAFADSRKTADEEHTIRKVAGLLHVPHPDFIDAKLRARASGTAEGGR